MVKNEAVRKKRKLLEGISNLVEDILYEETC